MIAHWVTWPLLFAGSRERFRTIFQAAPVSIWVEDLSGVRSRLDKLRASGVSDIGRYIDEHPEFLHELAKEPIVFDVNDATLQMLDVKISLNIPHDPSEYNNLLVSITDITDMKKADEQLRESEDKFRSFAEKSLVGVYLIQDGIFAYVNPRLAEIFGYDVDELIGKKGPKDLVYPEDWHIVEENLRKRINGEFNALRYDFRGITKQKGTLYIEVYGSRMIYRSRPAVIGTLVDITDRKKTETFWLPLSITRSS